MNTLTGISIPISPASATPTPPPSPTPGPSATPVPKHPVLPVVNVSVSARRIVEGADAVFTFTISPASSLPFTVGITEKIAGGGGRNVSFPVTNSVTFGAGQSTTSVTLHTVADLVVEKKQKFTVTFLKAPIYKIGKKKSATVTIVDIPH